MTTASYTQFRGNLETYFDRTAASAWAQLTSDAPVSGIRATVRAGRTEMRETLLSWLPADMRGLRLLDAGCGTGALAVAAAERGASVVAIDVAASLVQIARNRAPADLAIDWRVGDMLDPTLGQFDHVVAMDSLIHYRAFDIVTVVQQLAERTRGSVAFTFAPQTPLLMAMLGIGRLFPRADRSPAILPVRDRLLRTLLRNAVPGAKLGRDRKVSAGFYKSHALELIPA
ncbi:magnesium protoporphyrin IX methyltransferase [Sphingomonas echinoides]|jgi:magnesium-protoporphyrin O-methyltransferase|uniref:Magnesium protoporphyrin IX methyltransferase n=1 Tax=Sphingomonas echinoides TaxID=59803 RepID=A0ABU4PGQ1_9SPHN|nr:magnesium protoporphyrin IX methyltransferase [Sphingomonas echinoides]MDX5983388.1 magnesium protoporphyrin IX methyltransferase [Sphingomonas echinoides]